jgi:hypothetical protein
MNKLLSALALTGLLGFTACTDAYGQPDPVGTALLGAGVGAAAGLAVGAATQPRNNYYYGRPVYRGRYYAPPPRYYRGPPRYYRGHPRYRY